MCICCEKRQRKLVSYLLLGLFQWNRRACASSGWSSIPDFVCHWSSASPLARETIHDKGKCKSIQNGKQMLNVWFLCWKEVLTLPGGSDESGPKGCSRVCCRTRSILSLMPQVTNAFILTLYLHGVVWFLDDVFSVDSNPGPCALKRNCFGSQNSWCIQPKTFIAIFVPNLWASPPALCPSTIISLNVGQGLSDY